MVPVGGGNFAGQAVVFLASHAAHVHLLIRGSDLGKSMSKYLVDRIASLPNVTLHTGTHLSPAEFVRSGHAETARHPFPLETSVLGVFALGDVRANATKRVAAAVGEGAAVVAQVHAWMAANQHWSARTCPRKA